MSTLLYGGTSASLYAPDIHFAIARSLSVKEV